MTPMSEKELRKTNPMTTRKTNQEIAEQCAKDVLREHGYSGSSKFVARLASIILSAIHSAGESEKELIEIGKRWKENSALENWFPVTAEQITSLQRENEELRGIVTEAKGERKMASDLFDEVSGLFHESLTQENESELKNIIQNHVGGVDIELSSLRAENERLKSLENAVESSPWESIEQAIDALMDVDVVTVSALRAELGKKNKLLCQAYRHTLDDCLRNRNRAAGVQQENGVRLTPEEQRQLGRDLAEHWSSQ